MKTKSGKRTQVIRREVFTAAHLKRYYPEGFKRALADHAERVGEDGFRCDEIMDSLKGAFKAAGVKMADWSIGAYGHTLIRAEFPQNGAAELAGPRALAWLENNLLRDCRAPWGLNKKDGNLHETYEGKWSRYYAPGTVRACPFTGVCYDDDIIEELTKSVKSGDTLKEAWEGLADWARKTLESEYEYDASAEAFLETADANGYEFTKDGRRI